MTLHRKVEYIIFGKAHRLGEDGYEEYDTDFDYIKALGSQVLVRLGGLLLSAENLRGLWMDANELQSQLDLEEGANDAGK